MHMLRPKSERCMKGEKFMSKKIRVRMNAAERDFLTSVGFSSRYWKRSLSRKARRSLKWELRRMEEGRIHV